MDHRWFSSLPKADQNQRKQFVKANQKVLDILSEIVYTIESGEKKPSQVDYDSPSWAFKQAHLNGRLQAYRELLALINVSDKEIPKE